MEDADLVDDRGLERPHDQPEMAETGRRQRIVPSDTSAQRLAKNSASATAWIWTPAAAKVASTRPGTWCERAGITIGYSASSLGVTTLREVSA